MLTSHCNQAHQATGELRGQFQHPRLPSSSRCRNCDLRALAAPRFVAIILRYFRWSLVYMTTQVDSDAHNERVLDDSFPGLLALRLHENAADAASHSLSWSLGLLIRACESRSKHPTSRVRSRKSRRSSRTRRNGIEKPSSRTLHSSTRHEIRSGKVSSANLRADLGFSDGTGGP